MTHMCPTGCGRKAGEGKLMCYSCWKEVPADIQREVWRTFRAWRGGTGPWKAYLEARDKAIGAIS